MKESNRGCFWSGKYLPTISLLGQLAVSNQYCNHDSQSESESGLGRSLGKLTSVLIRVELCSEYPFVPSTVHKTATVR
jgi:hypothetical protein